MGTSEMLSNGAEGDREAVEGGRLKGGIKNMRRSRHHNPRGAAPSTLTPQVCPKASVATATF